VGQVGDDVDGLHLEPLLGDLAPRGDALGEVVRCVAAERLAIDSESIRNGLKRLGSEQRVDLGALRCWRTVQPRGIDCRCNDEGEHQRACVIKHGTHTSTRSGGSSGQGW
jgi:hypothetical protein